MNIGRVVVVLFAPLASGHTQGSPGFCIASLQMPCYLALARQAKVQGQVKVRVEVGKDGTVILSDGLEGNPMLQAAALPNSRTWKFGGGQGC